MKYKTGDVLYSQFLKDRLVIDDIQYDIDGRYYEVTYLEDSYEDVLTSHYLEMFYDLDEDYLKRKRWNKELKEIMD